MQLPWEFYVTELKEYADKIIKVILSFPDGTLLHKPINPILEMYSQRFFKEIYIKKELLKSQKYDEYKKRHKTAKDSLNAVMTSIFTDIAVNEKFNHKTKIIK